MTRRDLGLLRGNRSRIIVGLAGFVGVIERNLTVITWFSPQYYGELQHGLSSAKQSGTDRKNISVTVGLVCSGPALGFTDSCYVS